MQQSKLIRQVSVSAWRNRIVPLLSLMVVLAPFVVTIPLRLNKNDLWHDEGWVANMIASPTAREMIFYESHPRIVPPLFLVIERCVTQIFGYSDGSLRLFPVFAHVATAILSAYLILRLTMSRAAALVALSLVLYGPGPLSYAFQVKHYTTDCLVSAVILVVAHLLLSAVAERRIKAAIGYATLVLPLPLLSFVSALPLACLIAALALGYLFTRQRAAIAPVVIITLSLIFFILYDRYVVKPAVQSLFAYWGAYFPIRPTVWGTIVRLLELLAEAVRSMMPRTMFSCVLVMFCVLSIRGLCLLARDCPYYAMFVASTLVAPIVASLMHMYPLAPRLLLFVYPVGVFLAAYGATPRGSTLRPASTTGQLTEGQGERAGHRLDRLARNGNVWASLGALVACVYFIPSLLLTYKTVASTKHGAAAAFSRAVREKFLPEYDSSDEVVVYYGAAYLFKHYTHGVRIRRPVVVGHYRFRSEQKNILLFEKHLRGLNRKHRTAYRLWSVWDHGYQDEIREMKALVKRRCRVLNVTTGPKGNGKKHIVGYRCRP